MGGCASTPSSSSPRTTTPTPSSPRPITNRNTPRSAPRARAPTSPSTSAQQSTNPPLHRTRPYRSTSTSQTWTRARLATERTAFFDTRVTGAPEAWAAVRVAVGLLRDDGDAAGARGLLDAAGCLCPTGRLEDGVWDERGGLYALPRWVVAEPVGLREDSEEGGEGDDEAGEKMRAGVGVGVDVAGGPAEYLGTGAEADLGGEEDGPRGTDPATQLRVRARLSDRATDIVVCLPPAAPVRALIRAVQAEAGLPPTARIRLAYMGRVLRDAEPLPAQGWREGHVVSALVSPAPA